LTNEPAASPKVETAQFLGRIGAIAREVESAIEEFRRNDREEVQKAIDEAESTRRRSLVSFLTAVGVLFVLSVALSIRFTRGISHPIGILRAGAAKIREGDLAHRIDLKTGDELEEFSREFNQMAHRLEDVHRSQSELIEARTRQLVRSEKLAGIGTLAAGVAHEINNPLASVAGYAEALRRRAESPALRRCQDFGDFPKYLEVIAEETYRCKEIIGNLLDFSRQREPVFESVDLAASLQKTCDLLRHQSGMEKKRLEVCCTNGPLTVQGDETQLRHAFFNLLRNAAEAIEESGDVRVSAQERDGQVVIEIEDTGKGIAADDLPRVLEPFYTTKPPGKGTGLGLSVSYGIIQSHGGELEIHSDGAGRGCRVTVSLPMSSPPGKVET
jgi:signal transduction histidine kinase